MIALVAIPALPARAEHRGRIEGRVTDTSGHPLEGICATAVTRSDVAFPVHTDASGRYAISVPSGTYGVYFAGCGQSPNYGPQWYPDRPSKRTARWLHVGGGEIVTGIDARMQAGGEIAGRVLTRSGRSPGAFFTVFADAKGVSDADPVMSTFAYAAAADGSYTIVGLASGSYLVEFSAGGTGPAYPVSWYPEQPDPGHGQWVTVTAGQTTSVGVEILERPGAISGHVQARERHLVAGAVVTAKIREPDRSVYIGASTLVGSDGSYRLGGLASGEWTATVTVGPSHAVIARRSVLVAPGATTRLDVTVLRSPAMSGTVLTAQP